MSRLDRLLEQLRKRGLSVGPGDRPGELLLHGPAAEKTPEVMRALKACKDLLLEKHARAGAAPAPRRHKASGESCEPEGDDDSEAEICSVCGRYVSDPEDRERLADPLYCQQFGENELRNDHGKVLRKARARCPYKPWGPRQASGIYVLSASSCAGR